MKVIIDPNAGPCQGVKRALRLAEDLLEHEEKVVALGPIIHNSAEMERLAAKGLKTVKQEVIQQGDFWPLNGKKVFVRSHGITKHLYRQLQRRAAALCDGTCPTVRAVQRKIEKFFRDGYQILIVGKPGHPEVIGLNGYCDNQATILSSLEDIAFIRFSDKVLLLAQTTVARDKFLAIEEKILQIAPHVVVKDTICRQVTSRHQNIRNFAAAVDVVLLVGGKNSSNTHVLFDIAKQSNPHTFWIERQEEIQKSWLDALSVGITGSASTPLWQMEKIKEYVERITFN